MFLCVLTKQAHNSKMYNALRALYCAARAVRCAVRFVRAARAVSCAVRFVRAARAVSCAARFVLCCALYALYVALRAHYNSWAERREICVIS